MSTQPSGTDSTSRRVGSGIPGLDEVLRGGFPANRVHLIEGAPGTGKTTLALQFLLEGARRGEKLLYVTLSEAIEELRAVAQSHGWDLDQISLHELAPTEESLRPDEQYTILHPSEVEFGATTQAVLAEVERIKPARVVFDSLTALRLLAADRLRFRRQILGLKQFFAGRNCTVVLLDGVDTLGNGVQSLAHSVIRLEQIAPEYGGERRRLRVMKLRSGGYRGGYHDVVIREGGLIVYPRLVAAEHPEPVTPDLLSSGIPELDHLLGGGLATGTSTLLIGPAGVGKSVLGTRYALTRAERGEHVAVYVFDESLHTFLNRADGFGMNLRRHVEEGRISIRQLDPARVSSGELDHLIRQAVEVDGARVVVIDSLSSYLDAIAEERAALLRLRGLLAYLARRGVLTLLTIAQHGLAGNHVVSPLNASHLADIVILLQYFESAGQVRQAISVVKKRTGVHERAIRELEIGPGIRVGRPLSELQGVLAGSPRHLGVERSVLDRGDA